MIKMPVVHRRIIETLSSMLIQINVLQTQVDKEPVGATPATFTLQEGLKALEEMTREALSTARAACEDDPLPELADATLAEALSRLVESSAEMLGLSSRVAFSGADEQGQPKGHTLSHNAERLLYLVAREALYQVRQHSGARRLRLSLNYGQEEVQMSIEDDGVRAAGQDSSSFDASDDDTPPPPFGPQNDGKAAAENGQYEATIINDLRYRLAHLGGWLEITSLGERGTRFLARLPYTPPLHENPEVVPPIVRPEPQLAQEETMPMPDEQVTVLIVDSQAVTRAGLHRLLETYAGIQVIGEAADGVQAVSETLELGPQLVLMDMQLPNGQSLEALRQIKQLNQETRVLLLSAQDREEYLYETLRAGADGYVLKDIAPDELAQAIRAVAHGEVLIQPQLVSRLLSRVGKQGRGDTLTARELEVLRLLARGLRNKEIAARLFVSERTVNFHLANIYQKLNVSGRTEALSKALEQGLITA
jgi:DNA-binding NarL/FixJ family response regulator